MADPVFLDTSGLVALLVADDTLHEQAAREFEAIGREGRPLVLTDWVLAELGNGLARTPARQIGAELIRRLLDEPRAQVIFVDSALLARGLTRYSAYADKTWGLADCVSFDVMEQTGCQHAFTHDRHFEQAGFRALLV